MAVPRKIASLSAVALRFAKPLGRPEKDRFALGRRLADGLLHHGVGRARELQKKLFLHLFEVRLQGLLHDSGRSLAGIEVPVQKDSSRGVHPGPRQKKLGEGWSFGQGRHLSFVREDFGRDAAFHKGPQFLPHRRIHGPRRIERFDGPLRKGGSEEREAFRIQGPEGRLEGFRRPDRNGICGAGGKREPERHAVHHAHRSRLRVRNRHGYFGNQERKGTKENHARPDGEVLEPVMNGGPHHHEEKADQSRRLQKTLKVTGVHEGGRGFEEFGHLVARPEGHVFQGLFRHDDSLSGQVRG